MKTRHIGLIGAALAAVFLAVWVSANQKDDQAEVALKAAVKTEVVDGDLRGAIEQYKKIIALPVVGRTTVATALLRMGQCHEKLGDADTQEARKAYERVVREYGDQAAVAAEARTKLAALGAPGREPGSAPGVTVRQVWAGPDVDTFGAPSRDGAYLTFRSGSEDLAIRDLATGKIRPLTKHQDVVWQSAYSSMPSPDGRQVAYIWYQDGRYELRAVGLEGGEPRVLYKNTEEAWLEPSDWSPDGKSILTVLNRKDGTNTMVLVSAADASVRLLKDFGERGPARPRFSRDGRHIAYALRQGPKSEQYDIFVLDVDGGREIPLVEHPANDIAPDWTPDGKRILFLSNRTGTMGAWWIQVAEGNPQGVAELVKPDLGQDVRPMGFTRDGSYYYGVHTEMNDVYIAELDLATGKLISAPSVATQRLVGTNSRPDWSPDGRQLLFLSKRGPGAWGVRALCVRSTESGEVRELASKLDRVTFARWSPDARSLLVAAQHPSVGFGLFHIDVQTGDFTAGPRPPGIIGWPPVMSGDGKAMFYQAAFKEPKKVCVMARNLEAGADKELFSAADPAYFAGSIALSPDGRQLAFGVVTDTESRSTVLKVVPAAGGEAHEVLHSGQLPWPVPIAWAPDGQSLLFVKQREAKNTKTELWLVPVHGGEPGRLELAAEGMRDICLHPDGRHIAFTSVQDRKTLWVLENFLPLAK